MQSSHQPTKAIFQNHKLNFSYLDRAKVLISPKRIFDMTISQWSDVPWWTLGHYTSSDVFFFLLFFFLKA